MNQMNPSAAVFSNNLNSNESQTRLLQTRIDNLEKNLLEIHNSVASYATKIAKTRDSADLLAANLLQMADSEKINTSLRLGLTNFANCLNEIQDFRDEEVRKVEEKVINELSIYGEITRKAKEELKSNSSSRSKQLSDLKEAKLRELVRSSSFNEVSNVFQTYELQIQKFEFKKICDIKKTFLEFTKSELLFHAKTIEMLTEGYKHLLSIDADSDLQEFCTFFNFTHLGSPKREDSTKPGDEDQLETISTLKRFNSAPNFNSSINKTNSDSYDSKSIAEELGNETEFLDKLNE